MQKIIQETFASAYYLLKKVYSHDDLLEWTTISLIAGVVTGNVAFSILIASFLVGRYVDVPYVTFLFLYIVLTGVLWYTCVRNKVYLSILNTYGISSTVPFWRTRVGALIGITLGIFLLAVSLVVTQDPLP
jgi:hypothetical protein